MAPAVLAPSPALMRAARIRIIFFPSSLSDPCHDCQSRRPILVVKEHDRDFPYIPGVSLPHGGSNNLAIPDGAEGDPPLGIQRDAQAPDLIRCKKSGGVSGCAFSEQMDALPGTVSDGGRKKRSSLCAFRRDGRRGLAGPFLKGDNVVVEPCIRKVNEALPVLEHSILQPTLLLDGVCLVAQRPGYGAPEFQLALTCSFCRVRLTCCAFPGGRPLSPKRT